MNSVCGDGFCRGFVLLAFAGLTTLLHQLGDDASPSSLVACADSRAGIPVEVLMEEHKVAPVWVGLKLLEIAEHWPTALLVLKKNIGHATRQFAGYFPQSEHLSRPGRELNCEGFPKIVMELLQRLDQQKVHREPDGSPPVGIAPEQT